MDIPEIANFDDLVATFLPPGKKYVKKEINFLTSPGENYASVILAIDITIKDEEDKEEVLHTVAKLLPPMEFMRKFMNVPYTVRNEFEFYQTILPTLRVFIENQSSKIALNEFPKYYGGRYSLDPTSKTLDDHCIFLLENLKPEGYALLDNFEGLDLEVSRLVLRKMADLHSSVIGLKERQPQVFKDKLMPFFEQFEIFRMDDGPNGQFMTCDVVANAVLDIVKHDQVCTLHLERITRAIEGCKKYLNQPKNLPYLQESPFASLIHADLWINNILAKTDGDKVVDVKFVDWQLYEYSSVVKDLFFFIFSSVREDVFRQHFDDLFKFYHNRLIENLKELSCPVDKLSFSAFSQEIKKVTNEGAFLYCMMALPSIFPVGDNVTAVHEVSKESMLKQVRQVSEFGRNRICMITKKLIEKGWI